MGLDTGSLRELKLKSSRVFQVLMDVLLPSSMQDVPERWASFFIWSIIWWFSLQVFEPIKIHYNHHWLSFYIYIYFVSKIYIYIMYLRLVQSLTFVRLYKKTSYKGGVFAHLKLICCNMERWKMNYKKVARKKTTSTIVYIQECWLLFLFVFTQFARRHQSICSSFRKLGNHRNCTTSRVH